MNKDFSEIIEMSNEQFDTLLEKRDALRARHEELCEICNEGYNSFRREISNEHARQRDRVWSELENVELSIFEQLQLENFKEIVLSFPT